MILTSAVVQYWEIGNQGPVCTDLVRLMELTSGISQLHRWKKRFLLAWDNNNNLSIYDLFRKCASALPSNKPLENATHFFKRPDQLVVYSNTFHLFKRGNTDSLELIKSPEIEGLTKWKKIAFSQNWMFVFQTFNQIFLVNLNSGNHLKTQINRITFAAFGPADISLQDELLLHFLQRIEVVDHQDLLIFRIFWSIHSGNKREEIFARIDQIAKQTGLIHLSSARLIHPGEFSNTLREFPFLEGIHSDDNKITITTTDTKRTNTSTYNLDIRPPLNPALPPAQQPAPRGLLVRFLSFLWHCIRRLLSLFA